MAVLPLPQRGQPIDYDYLYLLASTINNIAGQLSAKDTGNIIDKEPGSTQENITIGRTAIVAKKFNLKRTAAGTGNVSFNVSFGTTFDYPPVVTITPKRNATTGESPIDIVYINDITQTNVTGVVNTSAKGTFNIDLQLIAVGIKE
jgi:hypothetical protein